MSRLVALGLAAALLGGAAVAAARHGDEPGPEPGTAQIDLSRTEGRGAAFLRGFDYSRLYVAAGVDRIAAIDEPRFESPSEARELLPPQSLVVGIERNGEAHAYPTKLLSLHEVVNDVVGGEPVAVTWCPLCFTALGFDRRARGRTLRFAVSGYLYSGNLMLFDRETGSLWSQLLGGAVTGRYRGTLLRRVPLVHETWASWLARHPRTRVLSIRRDDLAERFTEPTVELGDRGEELSDAPYADYVSKVPLYFRRSVRGLSLGSLVLGVTVRGRSKAYPQVLLGRRRALEDVLAGEPLLLTYDDYSFAASAFSRRLGSRVLGFRVVHGRLVDRETGSRWSLAGGRAVAGPLAGSKLERLPATLVYWFAWTGLHPATAVAR